MHLVHFKKAFPLTLLGHTHLKEELTDDCLFQKLPGYSIFLHRRSRQRMVNILLMIKINPTCMRLFIFTRKEKNRNLVCVSKKQVLNC